MASCLNLGVMVGARHATFGLGRAVHMSLYNLLFQSGLYTEITLREYHMCLPNFGSE